MKWVHVTVPMGKSNKYYTSLVCVCVCVALVIQQAERMRRIILPSVACPYLQYFSTLSHKQHGLREKKLTEHKKLCFDYLCNFCLKYFLF